MRNNKLTIISLIFFHLAYDFFYKSEKWQQSTLQRTSCILSNSSYGATIDQRGTFCPDKSKEAVCSSNKETIAISALAVLLFLIVILTAQLVFIILHMSFRNTNRTQKEYKNLDNEEKERAERSKLNGRQEEHTEE